MATVELVDGRVVEHVQLTNIEHVGDEGSRRAIAHIDGKTYKVFNSIVDGFDPVWYEQVSFEIAKGTTGFVEGSATISDETIMRNDDDITVTEYAPGAYNVWSQYSGDVNTFTAGGLLQLASWIEEHRGQLEQEADRKQKEGK